MLRNIILGIVLLGMSAGAEVGVKKFGQVFEDEATFVVELVPLTGLNENEYLAHIDGSNTEMDDKVVKIKSQGGGTSATYYVTEDGKNLLRAPAQGFSGWEAYIGSKTFKISLNKEKSKALKTDGILKLYRDQGKK